MEYFGDYAEDDTVYLMFNTFTSNDPAASCTITNFTNTDVHIHKDDGVTQRNNAAGITVSVDFDTITGSHMIKINTNDNTVAGFWVAGHDYFVRIEGTTIDAGTINAVVGSFSIENRFMRGTDSAATEAKQDIIDTNVDQIETAVITNAAGVDIAADIIAVKAETATIVTDTGTTLDTLIKDIPTVAEFNARSLPSADYTVVGDTIAGVTLCTTTTTNSDLISADTIADAVWDEVLTGATHNITNSAGKRVRDIGAYAIHEGTSQAGAAHSITLAAGASATDGVYNRNLLVIVGGTGAGQTRTIVDYNGTSKVAVVSRDWKTNPNATSEYQITAFDTTLVVDNGVAQAGGNTTITLRAVASATNDAYVSCIVAILAGTGRGQSRLINSYVGATKVATICNAWATNPDTTSVYAIMPYGSSRTGCVSPEALTQINTEVDTCLTDIHLDHLLAANYDPASKPGAATALLNELIESDAGVSRYTANALEQAPSGSGATAAEVRIEMDSNSTKLTSIETDSKGIRDTAVCADGEVVTTNSLADIVRKMKWFVANLWEIDENAMPDTFKIFKDDNLAVGLNFTVYTDSSKSYRDNTP